MAASSLETVTFPANTSRRLGGESGVKTRIGRGTAEEPFAPIVRHIINFLIRNPRSSVEGIREALKGIRGASGLSPQVLERGALAEVLQFRLQIRANKHSFPATTLLEVRLKKRHSEQQTSFEEEIRSVPGVIEWDAVKGGGDDADYLVRIVNRGKDFSIRDQVGALPSVEQVNLSKHFDVLYSGIVDNFTPDDFLIIEPDPRRPDARE